MKREIVVSVRQEGGWFVAQALNPDVASQGESVNVALANLREALELYYEPPVPTVPSQLHRLEVEVAAG